MHNAKPRRISLGVNIDHAATLRQARYREMPETCGGIIEPDPVHIALLAEDAGADGITAHMREDLRHIQERDILRLRESLRTRLNLEMSCEESIVAFALRLRPDSVCLVPEKRAEVSTEGGLDVAGQLGRISGIAGRMRDAGITASLFIDPAPEQVAAAAKTGAPCVELHTGAFANARRDPARREAELSRLRRAAGQAVNLDLTVNAGHGINYHNVREILSIPHLNELNIGHSILSRALLHGIGPAVHEMLALLRGE
ncbi:MAG: pyridoxine 5'-phosphate synthase [Puniceicoccales bacterium]|jgi:pyridoxine 5-phosphate synthase|nr:pyridoxine 5'-phosphate synthase [Puniceicoccales bacterium]